MSGVLYAHDHDRVHEAIEHGRLDCLLDRDENVAKASRRRLA
jgi:hypothetical protein